MELRLPTPRELETAYRRDLTAAFPSAELKPLEAITRHLSGGRYRPWCLFDGETLLGECFLWSVEPGWALLDYLCVSAARRGGGLGALLLEQMRRAEAGVTVFAETETPALAPDPLLAERRQGFYRRNGARFASFRSCVFGVCYDLICWSERPVSDETLLARYDAVYRRSFPADKYTRYVQIPFAPGPAPMAQLPWDEGVPAGTERDDSV